MTPTQRALRALREARAAGRGTELILMMLERKPSAFYDCWRELNKGEVKKPVVPPSQRNSVRPFGKIIMPTMYRCEGCWIWSTKLGINKKCMTCDPAGMETSNLNVEVVA